MRSAILAFTFLITASGLGPAVAEASDIRYGCMAQEGGLKLAVHAEFSEELGGRLSHLTGKIGFDPALAPAGLMEVRLTSEAVTQYFAGPGSLSMRFYDETVPGKPLALTMATTAKAGDTGRLEGTYVLDQAQEKGPGFHREGALFCQVDTVTPALPSLGG